MNPHSEQDRITPEVALKHALAGSGSQYASNRSISSPSRGSSLHDNVQSTHNKRPRPSNQSPRTEDLVRRKNESEQKFRSLMGSIQMMDDSHDWGISRNSKASSRSTAEKSIDTTSVMPSSRSGEVGSSTRKKSKKSNRSKHSSSRNGDGTSSRRSNRSGRQRNRQRRRSKEQSLGTNKPNSSRSRWGIKSVVSDNMESWEHFDPSESDFSESNAESVASFSEDPHADLLMQTPISLLDRPKVVASAASPTASKGNQDLGSLQPHPSLGHLVVMDRSQAGSSRAPPQRRRREKSSSSSSEQESPSSNKKESPKRHASMVSNDISSTNKSLNPTPSVIADGVQQLAAKLDIDVPGTSPSSLEDKVSAEFLNDDDSEEIRKKAARSASRRSRVQKRPRRSFTPEGIELDIDDQDSMSTISHDPVLDYMAATKARKYSDVSNEVNQVQNVLSEQKKQSLLAEVVKIARETQIAERQKMKSSRYLGDVLEASQEEENTDNETPTQGSRATSSTPQGSRETSGAVSHDFVTTVELTEGFQNDRAIDSDERDLEWNAIVIESPVEPYHGGNGCKESVSKMARNPKYLAAGAIALILTIVAVSVVLALRPTSGGSSEITPTSAPTYSNSEIYDMIAIVSPTEESALQNLKTPQGKAIAWVVSSTANSIRSSPMRIIQRYALATLFFATRGENWRNSEGWIDSEDECEWFSSVDTPCGEEGNFRRLDLRSNELHGELPEEVSLLSDLLSISLPTNGLFGTIPFSLTALNALTSLDLDANAYTKKLPSSITNLSNLKMLSMNLNRFTGELPASISNMKGLEVLSLAANRMSAGLPADISKLVELRELNLEFNKFAGIIRTELGLMRKLEYIKLDVNLFSNNIPTELGLLVNLKSFTCNECSLFGSIPTEIGFLGELETIELQSNQLDGSLPDEFGLATSLRRVDLSSNRITRSLPTTLGLLVDIKSFNMAQNKLTGTLPTELSTIQSETFEFALNGNMITGSVPEALCTVLIESKSVLLIDTGQVLPCNCLECHTVLSERKHTPMSSLGPEPGNSG